MDTDDSNVYVAKLLKQLEELKKKRDRRLQTLKKLKKPSSCKQDNTAETISSHKTEDVSQPSSANNERRDSSEVKCSKCRLCLISKDSPCIQCLSAEYKENSYQKNSESGIAPHLRVESANSENRLDPCNDSISVKEKQNLTNETFKFGNSGGTVSKPPPNNRSLSNFDEVLTSDSCQITRKQKRRSSTFEDEPGQNDEYDHKKLKLSKDILREDNGPDISYSVNGDHFKEGSIASSVRMPDESEEKISDVVEDSLLHDMSCFLSSSLLGEEEDKTDTNKKSIPIESEKDREKSDWKSSLNNENILSCSVKVNRSDIDANNFVKTGYYSSRNDPIILDEPKSEALFGNGDCVLSVNTSNSFDKGITKVLDIFPDGIAPCIQNLENIHTINVNKHSDIKVVQGDKKVENSTPQLEEKSDFKEVCGDTLNCLPDVKPKKHEMKAYTDTNQDSQSNSQLIEDLKKTSNFSSFENSNSGENGNVANVERVEDNPKPSLLDSFGRTTAKNIIADVILEQKNVMDNETPDLLHDTDAEYEEQSSNCVPETSGLKCNRSLLEIEETENLFGDDALTADIDFESASLEVADTVDDLLTKSCKSGLAEPPDEPFKSSPKLNATEMNDVFTVPETELLDAPHFGNTELGLDRCKDVGNATEDLDKAPCDAFDETQCDTLDQLQTIQDSVFLDAEDSLELGKYKNIPFSVGKKTSSSDLEVPRDEQETLLKHVCCLQSDIDEPVKDIKLVFFNCSSYVFIQHVTWIQVWRQEENKDWAKIFAHQVDLKLTLKEICFTKDASHLVLVMLLCSDQVHCLQFLLFESEARVIKLMEHTHWLQNRCPGETVLVCGLGDLKFATAQGKETFDVFLHVFSSLEDNPRLMMATLGSTTAKLHSLCNIEKLPNALMGTTTNTLYVWHLLEARLVTSVSLQLPDPLSSIERCIWATIENGLVFMMAVCKGKGGFSSPQLLATNLATGLCQIAMAYSFLPSTQEPKTSDLNIVYSEPFLAGSCKDGAFLWSVTDEHCCAALEARNEITSTSIGCYGRDTFLVAVGNGKGCVNCFTVQCT